MKPVITAADPSLLSLGRDRRGARWRRPAVFGWMVVLWVGLGPLALGHASTADQELADQELAAQRAGDQPLDDGGPESRVQFGITGHCRLGCWTAIQLRDPAAKRATALQTLDGDGMQVEFQVPYADHQHFYAVPGSEAAPLKVIADGGVLLSTRFPEFASPSRGPSMIPLGMSWIVAVGDPLQVDEIGAVELLNREAKVAVSRPGPADLPDSSLGYDGVDLIMISGDGHHLLAELSDKQQQAIKHWVLAGGRLFVTLGGSTGQLIDAAPWLLDFIPIERDSLSVRSMNPSAIESYTSTQTPLSEFDGVMLPRGKGRVLITGRTARRVSTPQAAEYFVGFGRVTVVAADLASEEFANWPDRLALVTRLLGSVLVPEGDTSLAANRVTAFNDLAGQMRATLDQFPLKRKFGFSLVALILMALIAAIGPLDYLVINRVLGRPLLGWLSFPLVAIALSVILIYQSRPATAGKTSEGSGQLDSDSLMRRNRLEIIDIDSINNVGRGFSWSFLYSHPASRFDVQVRPSELLAPLASKLEPILTAPFGYPGRAFGGIQIAGEDARFPSYQVQMNPAGGLLGLSLAPRSSKSIASRIAFTPDVPAGLSISRRLGSELLRGSLENPFPFDLLDGMLIYRNSVYLLPTRFPANGKIQSVNSLRQKNFRWQLSRQMALEKSKTESEQWVPSRFDRPDRVAEMVMFHRAVGGSRYTMLRDDPLSFLDLSKTLVQDRCVLVGKLPASLLDVRLTPQTADGNESTITPEGQSLAIVRLVMPVESQRESSTD